MPRTLLRLGNALLIVALLGISGAQWFVLQSIAWGTMLAENARHSAWSEAVHRTFDGAHPCALCKKIEQGKKSEKKADVTFVVTKINLFHQADARFVMREREMWKMRVGDFASELRFEQPPLPPPRVA